MNTFLVIILALGIFMIWGVWRFLRATSALVRTANAFFSAVHKRDIDTAFSYLSEEFRAGTNEMAFREFLSNSALINFRSATWDNRSVATGGRGELTGAVVTETGGTVPLKIAFIKENGVWRIYSMYKPPATLGHSNAALAQDAPVAPDKAETVRLARQSIHDFAVSVSRGSMDHFRSTVSQLWQQELSTERFNEIFGMLLQGGLNFAYLDTLSPAVSMQASGERPGIVQINGLYCLPDVNILFETQVHL